MKLLKIVLIISIIISAFVGYSYYNYNKRSKYLNAVESFKRKNNLTEIWYIREGQFNIFDWLLQEKTQKYFIFINEELTSKLDNSNYTVYCVQWKEPNDPSTLKNYVVRREGKIFHIDIKNIFNLQLRSDSLSIDEVKGTIFEVVDGWIQGKFKPIDK
jgi:hypothetical protein